MGKKCKNCGWDGNHPDWKLCGRCGLDPDVVPEQPTAKSEQLPQLQDKPILTLDRSYIDFGSMIPGTTLSKTFNIRNEGTGTLVGKITSGERWIGVFPTIINLREPEEGIQVTIDTSLIPLNFRGSGYIDVQTNGGNARIEVKVNTQTKKQTAGQVVGRQEKVVNKRGWFRAGVALVTIGLLASFFSVFMAFLSIETRPGDITNTAFVGIVTIGVLAFIIPGLMCLRKGVSKEPVIHSNADNIQNSWWFLPLLLGFIGGIVSWSKHKSVNMRKALNMLICGIAITVTWPMIITTIDAFVSPKLEVNTAPIYFSNIKPDKDSPYQIINIQNIGAGKLLCNLSVDKEWLRISPIEVEVGKNEKEDITVWINTSGLKYKLRDTGNIRVITNGGEDSIPVYLTTTELIYEDDFSNQKTGWYVGSYKDSTWKYQNGGYRVSTINSNYIGSLPKDVRYWTSNKEIGQFDDFVLEIDIRSISSAADSVSFLAFRMQDDDNCYYFLLCSA